MKITSINIKPVSPTPDAGMVARVSMTIDEAISLRGMRLVRRKDGNYFLGMASQRRRNNPDKVYDVFHPITAEGYKKMSEAALAAYDAAMAETDVQSSYIYDKDSCGLDEALNITAIRFAPVKRAGSHIKAFVAVTLDNELVLHQIRLIQRDEDGPILVTMPNFAKKDKESPSINIFHPISSAARIKLSEAILAAYEKFLDEQGDE